MKPVENLMVVGAAREYDRLHREVTEGELLTETERWKRRIVSADIQELVDAIDIGPSIIEALQDGDEMEAGHLLAMAFNEYAKRLAVRSL